MTTKHTATPWRVTPKRIYSADVRIDNYEKNGHVCTVGWQSDLQAHTDAAHIVLCVNAHDDMLKALQGVLRVADRKTDEFDAARPAIAKATA